MLMLPFLIVVVRVMPSDFESASSEGDREQPPSDKNGEYQGQRSGIHKPSPTSQTNSTTNRLAVTHITDSRGEKRL